MNEELKLDTPLRIDEVDFRIQSINKGGYATILVYKDARTDYRRLNTIYGAGNWQRKHEMIGDRLYCSVGIYHEASKSWVWVQDVGTESNAEKEKGQASDSFKRACFNLGIGAELYDYPVISVKLKSNEWTTKEWNGKKKQVATWDLKLRDWVWHSEFTDGKVSFLSAVDDKGEVRYESGKKDTSSQIDPKPINHEHVNYAVNQYRELINADVDEIEKFPKMQAIHRRLSNDERMAVMSQFGDEKHVGGRLYRTLVADYLKMKKEDLMEQVEE